MERMKGVCDELILILSFLVQYCALDSIDYNSQSSSERSDGGLDHGCCGTP
jgi:hypothetical protein